MASFEGTTTISTSYLRMLADSLERSLDAGQSSNLEWSDSLRTEHQRVMGLIATAEKTREGQERVTYANSNSEPRLATKMLVPQEVAGMYTDKEVLSDIVDAFESAEKLKQCLNTFTSIDAAALHTILDHVYCKVPCQNATCMRIRGYGAQPILEGLKSLIDTSSLDIRSLKTFVQFIPRSPFSGASIKRATCILTNIQFDDRRPVTFGAFGDIYKGKLQGRTVCLKIPRKVASSDSPLQRMSHEVGIWSQLSHINVLPFYGVMQLDDSRIALVSPWMHHGNILEYLKMEPNVDRRPMVSDVAAGLSYLHSLRIIHGDVKGINILVTASTRACLADFGLSFIANTISIDSSLQRDGPARWMAPELMEVGEVEALKTEASDVYAFSMTVLEIFTDHRPFRELLNDASVVLTVARGGRPRRPSFAIFQSRGLTDNLWDLLEACWVHNPLERPSSKQIYQELPRLMDDNRRPEIGWQGHLEANLSFDDTHLASSSRTANTLRTPDTAIQQLLSCIETEVGYHAEAGSPNISEVDSTVDSQMASVHEMPLTEADEMIVSDDRRSPPVHCDDHTIGRNTWFADITGKLSMIFKDVDQYKQVLNCPRTPTQIQGLLDLFQMLLDNPSLDSTLRHNLVVAIQRFCKTTNMYPKCFSLGEGDVILDGDCPVAAGGFADIHKAKFQDTYVCLKVIRLYQESRVKYALKRFYQEAILWGQLSHPNLLPFYGLYHFRSRLCLVSPWAMHGDIITYLLANPRAIRILLALDIATGLAYLHESDIIHGDIKGANILVSDSGRACVADFGLSSVTDTHILEWTSHSSAASKGGSIRWQAPELYGVDDDVMVPNSKESDVYAWACVCYEIFSGEVPFYECRRDATVMLNVGRGKRPSRPDPTSAPWTEWGLTKAIWSLMESCWLVEPEQRPTVTDIVDALAAEAAPDMRPSQQWDDVSPSNFKNLALSKPPTSLIDMDAMLWGTNADKQSCRTDTS